MKKFSEYKKNNKLNKSLLKFCIKRKKGAMNIAERSRAKGDVAILTAWHFFAKLPAYDKAIQHIQNKNIQNFLESQVRHLTAKIHPDKLTQKEFQEIMGELEVYGEIICQIKKLSR